MLAQKHAGTGTDRLLTIKAERFHRPIVRAARIPALRLRLSRQGPYFLRSSDEYSIDSFAAKAK